jgi:hypothetical protein
MNFGPWGTFADESYAPQAERARDVVVGVVGPDSSRLLNFVFADYPRKYVIWHCERYGDYANNQSCPRSSGYKKKKRAESIDSARRLTICAPSRDYAAIAILRSDLKPVRTSSEKICGCSQAAK